MKTSHIRRKKEQIFKKLQIFTFLLTGKKKRNFIFRRDTLVLTDTFETYYFRVRIKENIRDNVIAKK